MISIFLYTVDFCEAIIIGAVLSDNEQKTLGENIPSTNTLLVIGYVWPEPNSSAAGSRMLSLLQAHTSQGWRVVFASPAQHTEHQADLQLLGIESHVITLNCSSFDAFVRQLQPARVMFDRFMMEEQFAWRVEQAAPSALRILDTEDLQCLRHARHVAIKAARPFGLSDLNTSELALREIAAIYRSDISLMISEYEVCLLTEQMQLPAELLQYCPFFMTPASNAATTSFQERRDFVFIGNYRHAPNWDAVLWLRKLWPAIRQQLPDAQLHIYGAYPPPKATALHNPKLGFLIEGWASSAEQVLSEARVCLAPLRFGAGLKGKLVEAMQAGTPSVTTDVGAEGILAAQANRSCWPGKWVEGELFDGDSIDSPDSCSAQFVEACAELYQSEPMWRSAQQLGFEVLVERFDEREWSRRFMAQLDDLQCQLDEHRQRNFVGQMLRHHSHKSTQYMSQWIEAKRALEKNN